MLLNKLPNNHDHLLRAKRFDSHLRANCSSSSQHYKVKVSIVSLLSQWSDSRLLGALCRPAYHMALKYYMPPPKARLSQAPTDLTLQTGPTVSHSKRRVTVVADFVTKNQTPLYLKYLGGFTDCFSTARRPHCPYPQASKALLLCPAVPTCAKAAYKITIICTSISSDKTATQIIL